MKYLVGIDIGTTGAKCGIFNFQGDLLAQGYREYTCDYPQPNWVEQDAEMVVEKAMEATKDAVISSKIDPNDMCSIALSTQRTCSIFLDSNHKPMKMISWQDNRTSAEVKDIAEKISEEEFYSITGLPLNTTWIITKIMWMRKNCKELWKKTKKVVQLQDYTLKQFGADDYYVDIPDNVLSGLWDTNNFHWSDKIIDLFDIDRNILSIPTKCGTKVGELSKEAALKMGLKEGIPLCVGAGDQNSAAIGAGIINEGIASVSIGTGGMAIILLDKPYRDTAMKACVGSHAIYGKWQFEGYQIGAAGVFRWFRDEIAALEKDFALKNGEDVYKKLNEMIAEVPPGSEGLVFLPFLASAAAPRWNSDARGTFVGLTFAHERKHLARAFMEGITLEQKDILNSMKVTGNKVDTVRIMGGSSKSEIWCQMQADIYNKEVETLKVSDAALVGAAIFAGIGIGIFKDIKTGVNSMVKTSKKYYPRQNYSAIYDQVYNIYCNIYESLNERGVYSQIAEFQANKK